MKKISIMIPCYNEEENVRPIYEAVRDELLQNCSNYEFEITFIDNKSSDCTRTILREICAGDPRVKVIFNSKNFGQFNSPFLRVTSMSGRLCDFFVRRLSRSSGYDTEVCSCMGGRIQNRYRKKDTK